MEDTEQNKSEEPTHYKLTRARQKGAVARGTDLGFLTGLSALVGYGWIAGDNLQQQVMLTSRRALVAAPDVVAAADAIFAVTGEVFGAVVRPLLLLFAIVFGVVLLFEALQTGVVFSSQPLKPDFSRLNPAQNLKRLFSPRLLIETAKNVLKLAAYGAIGYLAIWHVARVSAPSITDGHSLAFALRDEGFRLLLLFTVAAATFAVFDQLIVRRDFLKKMRMSRREVRRESRDREGEPRMKQRRKQLHAEFVKVSQSLRGIRGSDVLITNPTHYAVALKYDGRTMAAPQIVAQGTQQVAARLRRLAFLYGIVVLERPELARALYRCPLNSEVPEALYRPVADIYMGLRRGPEARQNAYAG